MTTLQAGSVQARPIPSFSQRLGNAFLGRQLVRASQVVGLVLFSLLIVLALFPNLVAPYDATERVGLPLRKPSAEFRLGTNDLGQDLLSELIAGTRASVFTGLIVAMISVLTGAAIGVVSGYLGGWVDSLLMRLTDLILVMPFLPLVILLSVYLGSSQRNVIIVLSFFFWAGPARLIRSQVLRLREDTYIEAARALGAGPLQIMLRHLWAGVRPLVLTQIVLVASAAILAESSLSFLGLGDPSKKSWGTMLYFARASGAFLTESWKWWVLPTGLMITLTVLSLGLIGYSLESRLSYSES